jgi:hypothetical protein
MVSKIPNAVPVFLNLLSTPYTFFKYVVLYFFPKHAIDSDYIGKPFCRSAEVTRTRSTTTTTTTTKTRERKKMSTTRTLSPMQHRPRLACGADHGIATGPRRSTSSMWMIEASHVGQ